MVELRDEQQNGDWEYGGQGRSWTADASLFRLAL